MRLTFDFPAASGTPRRLRLEDPVEVHVARRVEEVRPALAALEAARARGLTVAGYLAYEAAPAFEPRMRVRTGNRMPLLWFGAFAGARELPDPDDGRGPPGAIPLGVGADGARVGGGAGHAPSRPDGTPPEGWSAEMPRARYEAAVARVREAIAEGRTYQVNLTTRLRAPAGEHPCALYERLRAAQGAGLHALLELDGFTIVSASPELFFRTRDGVIEARPMKGTRPRGRWPAEDRALAGALLASEKERAENLMIVDLLRSDLGRVARTGSVEVPRLLEVERYRTVHQMTSTIRARLRPATTLTELLTALFPCGSVTGAPKISTMELIAALEESPREVYCGAIGLAGPEGEATFSVPIRTAWIDHGREVVEYGVGSGITWDSGAEAEHAELLAKAAVLEERWPRFRLLETMRMEAGHVRRLERHLARLAASADYFDFPFPEAEVRGGLEALGRRHPAEPRRVRLVLGRDGGFDLEDEALERVGTSAPAPPRPAASLPEVGLAERPVHSRDRFLYHKTTHRGPYTGARAGRFDAVLWNESEQATEMTLGNLVVELAGRRVTPPLDAGLLPGCFRAELLERGEVDEGVVTLEALRAAPRLWRINSVREWEEVRLAE